MVRIEGLAARSFQASYTWETVRISLWLLPLLAGGCIWIESPGTSPEPTPVGIPDLPEVYWRVAAHGGFEELHVKWDPVPEAEEYRLAFVDPIETLEFSTFETHAVIPTPDRSVVTIVVRAVRNGDVIETSPPISARVGGVGWNSLGPLRVPNWSLAVNNFPGGVAMAAADFDRDGFEDLAVLDSTQPLSGPARLRAFRGSLAGLSTSETPVFTGTFARDPTLATADLNGDEVPDLIAGLQSDPAMLCTWLGSEQSFLVPGNCVDSGLPAWSRVPELERLGDLDGDGCEEVVARSYDSNVPWGHHLVEVFSGTDGGLLTAPMWVMDYGGLIAGAGDMTGDGRGDLLMSQWINPVLSLYQSSGGTLSMTPVWTLVSDSPHWSASELNAARDLTGDGVNDVLIGRSTQVQNRFWLMEGSLVGAPSLLIEGAGEEIGEVGSVADATRDGYPDVWITEPAPYYGTQISILPGGPEGPSVEAVWSISGNALLSLDSNGDSIPEFAVHDAAEKKIHQYPLGDVTFPVVDAGTVQSTIIDVPIAPVGWTIVDPSGHDGTCTWFWGDGTKTVVSGCAQMPAPAHAYSAPGHFVVRLEYTNTIGVQSSSITEWVVTPWLE